MMPFERKAKGYYGEVVINKGLMGKAGFGARAIPVYVGEWIVSQFMDGETLTEDGRNEIVNTVSKFMPQKADKNSILNRLMEQEEVRILDDFRVNVNLERHTHDLSIPLLDVSNAMVQKDLHDRWIETDTGWRIILGRGLDLFLKPEGKFTLGFMDQTKRRCKATTITYMRRP